MLKLPANERDQTVKLPSWQSPSTTAVPLVHFPVQKCYSIYWETFPRVKNSAVVFEQVRL